MKKYVVTIIAACFAAVTVYTAEEAQGFRPEISKTAEIVGRKLEYFKHGSDPAWGAANPKQEDSFAVISPKDGDRKGAPLYVVLHSAGHALESCLGCITREHDHDIYHPPADFYALVVDCKANANTDWWWGEKGAGFDETPVEKRVIATVRWTIEKYGIDPNRVYLSGNSMGGSGTLGIGLRHGDVFAAIKANVPARVTHCVARMGFAPTPTNAAERTAFETAVKALPEPPVCVDYSAPNDGWSKGHETLYEYMAKRKYPILGFWGNFGHENKNYAIAIHNDIIHNFDWLSVRRDAAYPVFSAASCDDQIDFTFGKEKSKKPGQVNGFFRWKNIEDTQDALALELRLVTPEELKSKLFTLPASATAEVAVRRLQRFRVKPGDKVKWTFGAASGAAVVGVDGILSCGRLTLSATPQTLRFCK